MIIHCSRTTVMSDMSKGQLRIVACHLGTWQIGSSQETSLKLQEHQVLQLQGVCANYTKTKLIQRQTQTANFPLYNFLRLQVTSSAEMTGIFSGQSFKMVVETSGTSGKCIPCGVIAFVKQLEMFSIRNTNVKKKHHTLYVYKNYIQHTSVTEDGIGNFGEFQDNALWVEFSTLFLYPIPSIYGIFTYIWLIFMVNVR